MTRSWLEATMFAVGLIIIWFSIGYICTEIDNAIQKLGQASTRCKTRCKL